MLCDMCMANLDEQDLCPNCEPGSVYVAVYEVTRNFGGHEEGGWWYDAGERILIQRFTNLEDAGDFASHLREGDYPKTGKRYSVLGGDDYDVEIWDDEIPPKYFPEERPYYE